MIIRHPLRRPYIFIRLLFQKSLPCRCLISTRLCLSIGGVLVLQRAPCAEGAPHPPDPEDVKDVRGLVLVKVPGSLVSGFYYRTKVCYNHHNVPYCLFL